MKGIEWLKECYIKPPPSDENVLDQWWLGSSGDLGDITFLKKI
jgi:hypothetical protein